MKQYIFIFHSKSQYLRYKFVYLLISVIKNKDIESCFILIIRNQSILRFPMPNKSHEIMMIVVLALLSIFPPLATDMYLPALGSVAQDLHTSSSAAELSLSVFFLGLCLGQLIMGPLIDAFGRKLPLIIGTVIFTLSSIALIFIDNIFVFNILRFIQALGACSGMVISRAIVTDVYQGKDAAKIMTLLVMLMTIGPIVSPTLGSFIFEGLGWRAIFVLLVIVGICALLLTQRYIPETLKQEQRVQRPFKDALTNSKILLKQKSFIVPVLIAIFVQAGMFAFITGSSGVFQGIFGLNTLQYGLTFAAIAISLLVFGQINKILLDCFSPEQILQKGLVAYVVMALITTFFNNTTSIWFYVIPLWFTIGFVSLLSANGMSLAMASARERAGIGSALLGVLQFGLAFIVSSCVAAGGSQNALPMSLGILIPALLAWLIWLCNKKSL